MTHAVPYEVWKTRDPLRIPVEVPSPIPVGTEVIVYGYRHLTRAIWSLAASSAIFSL
mgnify:CR=1 FL=1